MDLKSRIVAVTLFPRGAEVTRRAEVELSAGEHELVIDDLTDRLDAASLRVEGEADGVLQIGAVDSEQLYVDRQADGDESARRKLQDELEGEQDKLQALEARIETLQVQKKLMKNLAASPLHMGSQHMGGGGGPDWSALFELIGARLASVNDGLNALAIERRGLQKRIESLQKRLDDQPGGGRERRTQATISVQAQTDLKAVLILRYQVSRAGWTPLYDMRLHTDGEKGGGDDETALEIVRRAIIWQDSGEAWDKVALQLSTTRPSGGAQAPELHSEWLDLQSNRPPEPMLRMAKAASMAAPVASEMMASEMMMDEAEEFSAGATISMPVQELESDIGEGAFQAVFGVPGAVSHEGGHGRKKVRLGSLRLAARLEARATPLLDPAAYLHATMTLEQGPALLPGETALYRDDIFVGKGRVRHVNEGEEFELGFGADEQVQVRRIELADSTGRHGLIKSENTIERHYRIRVDNHHRRPMPVRILERLPVPRHDKIRVDLLPDSSKPAQENVDDRRGVLAFAADVGAGGEAGFDLHYRISWPKDERLA